MLCLVFCTAIKILLKCFLYLTVTLIVLLLGLKMWLQPVKRVCKCKTRLDGKVAVVTGGYSGIGLAVASALAARGARVVLACRSETRARAAVALLPAAAAAARSLPLDLASLPSVRRFADRFCREFDRLDILVNNAGVAGSKQKLTEDGIDLVTQVNYFGAFLLTNLLLDKLKASKPSRIVNVTSLAHRYAQFDIDDIAGHKHISYFRKYANSKLLQVLWTKALAKRLPQGVTVNCVHPGVVHTNIWNKLPAWSRGFANVVLKWLFKDPQEGAQTVIHLCLAPELADSSGGYYDECRPAAVAKEATDEALIDKVWYKSLELTDSRLRT